MDDSTEPSREESSLTPTRHVTVGFLARVAAGILSTAVWVLVLTAVSFSLRQWLLAVSTMSALAAWLWAAVLFAAAGASVAAAPRRRRPVVAAALALVSVLAVVVVGGSVPVQYSWPALPKPSPVLSAALARLHSRPERFVVSWRGTPRTSRVLQRGTIDWVAEDLTMSTWTGGRGYSTLVVKNGVTLSAPRGNPGVGRTWLQATTANRYFINPDQAVRFQGAWEKTRQGQGTAWSVRVVPDKANVRVWFMKMLGVPLRDQWGLMQTYLSFGQLGVGPLTRVAVTLNGRGSIAAVTYYSADNGTITTSFSPLGRGQEP